MIYLQTLHITSGYKLLQDFRLDFQELPLEGYGIGTEWLTVLLGNNGSGKSSVLEAITYIFRGAHEQYLHDGLPEIPFDFQLRYLISATTEEWVTLPSELAAFPLPLPKEAKEFQTRYADVLVTGQRVSDGYIITIEEAIGAGEAGEVVWEPVHEEPRVRELLPSLVIYYSGVSESILNIYRAFERSVLNESRISATDTSLMEATALPLYYLQAADVGLLLAALFSFEFNAELDDFLEYTMRMQKPEQAAVIIVIRPPSYGNKKGRDYYNGWKSEGVLGAFLDQLRDKVTFVSPTIGQDAYTLHFNLSDWYKLREAYTSERELLALLLLLKANNMVVGAGINFMRDGLTLSDEDLSEGEQQLLVVRALAELLVLNNEGTLLLFDEPDTFLHPKWQQEFFKVLEPFAGRASCIVTTHSPILLTHLKTGNLVRMEGGKAQRLPGSPYGQRYADTLMDYMGLGSRPPVQDAAVEKVFTLLEAEDVNIAAVKRALQELRELVGADDPEVQRAETLLAFWEN